LIGACQITQKDLSSLNHVAQAILNAVNSTNPELRYPVGKDAELLFKLRTELSDRELEQWVRESYMEKKGFVRR
jgi:hypothetical protein